ncbi:RhoGAP domain [Pelomyxa schiedti]|nr:RhoGAP domain [Pelomyxa schiedti]
MTSPRRHQYAYRSTLENLEESIIEGEETFLKILNQLRDVYLQPLLSLISLESSPTTPNTTPASPPSSLFPDALADLKQLIDAQSQFVVHLRDRRLLAQPLAANYALFPNLFVAYKKYIGGQMIFIMKLSTLMQNNLKIAALVDSKTEDPQANKLTIWDMLGISVRRLPQLIDVLTAQFELLVASDIGRCASIDYGKLYKKRYLLPSPGQVFPDSCRQGKQALDSLAGLVVDAQRAEEFYSAMLFVQSISTRNRHESIPNNPARRMFKQGEMLLMQNHDVGLSVTIPVVLLLFSDCLAICTKQSSEHSHCFQLHSLYPTPSLIVCDTEATTKALTFTIDIIKTLPTGWIETVVLNPHHRVWSLEKSKITQQEPPSDYISAVMGPVTFVASRAEEKQDWLFAFASATSFAYIKSSIPTEKSAKLKKNKPANTKKKSKKTTAPKSNFGVPLDTLITRDRIHHPGCNLPILVSRLVHHVLSYGLAEEGILRLAGDKEGVEEIKLKIDNSKITDFSFIGMYIHNVSTILKQFLRELPEPLIPYSLGDMFLSISSLPKHLQASALMMNLRELPPFTHHLPLLRCVLQCLYIVSLNSHLNQMTPENVAIVMAPNIFRLPPGSNPVAQIPFTPKATIVTAAMIANYPVLFESPDSPSLDNDVDFVRFKRKISAFPKTTLHNLAHIPARNQIWIVDTEGYIISVDSNQCTFGSRTQVVGVKNVVSLCASGPNVWIATPLGLRVIATDTLLVVFQDDQACYGVVSTGSEVWVGGQGCVTVYDSTSFSMIKTINVGDGEVRNLTKVGLSIWCSTHQATSPTQDIHILDCSIYAQECHFAAHSRKINSICCVEGATVWSCCDEGIISVWDVSSQRRKEKLDLGQGSIHCLAALRKQVWASTKSNVTTILEARTSKKIGAIRGYHREPILALIPIPTKFDTKEKALGVTRPTAWDVWSMAVESVCVWDARYLDCRFADKPKDKLKAFKS